MTPRISVLMPVANGMPYLTEAVESILKQDEPDFEFIIVDDGSDDDTPRILQEFCRRDSRVRVLTLPRSGITRALNVGMAVVRAPLVARMDADDIAHPSRFRLQAEYLRRHSEAVAVGSWTLRIDPDSDPITVGRWPCTHAEIDASLLEGHGGLAHPTAMMRTDVLRKLGGYREEFRWAQDKDLWLRLAEQGRLANLPQPLLCYREHFRSTSWQRAEQQRDAVERALADARRRRGLPAKKRSAGSTAIPSSATHEIRFGWVRQAWRRGNYATARKHLEWLVRNGPTNVRIWWRVVWGRLLFGFRGNVDHVPRCTG